MENISHFVQRTLLMAFVIDLLLALTLIRNFKMNKENGYILVILLILGVGCIYSLSATIQNIFYIKLIINALPAQLGLFVYLYIAAKVFNKQVVRSYYIFSFALFVLAFVLAFYDNRPNINLKMSFFLNVGLKGFLNVYFVFRSFQLVRKSKNVGLNQSEINYQWLYFVLLSAMISFMLNLLIVLYSYIDVELVTMLSILPSALSLLFLFPIGYYGFSNSNTFFKIMKEPKGKSFELPKEKTDEIFRNLEKKLKTEKNYLIESIKIEDIAKELNVSSKYLSYVINFKTQKTFFDFINSYRIQEFNQRVKLSKNHHLTFLAVAYECGFGSKSAFNRAYKKEMEVSPSEYLKNCKK